MDLLSFLRVLAIGSAEVVESAFWKLSERYWSIAGYPIAIALACLRLKNPKLYTEIARCIPLLTPPEEDYPRLANSAFVQRYLSI